MSAVASLTARLRTITSEHALHDDEERRRGSSGLGGFGQAAGPAPIRSRISRWDDEDRRGGGGRGVAWAGPARHDRKGLRDGAARASGLASGGQKAVVKVVSFASGHGRVGALAAYVTKEREGGVATEDQDGFALDGAAVQAKLERWRQGYSERKPSEDVATVRLDVVGRSGLHGPVVESGVSRALDGHRFALRSEGAGEGSLVATVVVAAAADRSSAADASKPAKRFKFDKPFEASLAARISEELGTEVGARVLGTGHGREGVLHRLSRLVAGGTAIDDQGQAVSTAVDVRTRANAWRKGLGSRQARDAMHLVVSAKAGTNPDAFRATARELLATEFAGHEYLFAVHNDRGHLHAHAVILVKGGDGQRIRPDISSFAAWRASYAEIAERHGIRMVATRRSDTASPPAFRQGEAALTDRGVAPDHIRRKVLEKRADAIHVPSREEGRQRASDAYRDWSQVEATASTPEARESASDSLTRLAAAVNLSHSARGRSIARLPAQQRGTTMARATGDYLAAEFSRANEVLNRALPMLEGADKVEATQVANAYLTSLAKQVEAVQALEAGHVVERAHAIQAREEREAVEAGQTARTLRATAREAERNLGTDTAPEDGRAAATAELEVAADRAERTAARERAEADAMSREEQAFRANPAAPAPADQDLPAAGEDLRTEQELLIDRIAAQKLAQTRVHRR